MDIDPYLPKVLESIETKSITCVVAPTGSGKSIGIPRAVAAVQSRIFVVVPTVIAAMSLADRQKVLEPKYPTGFAAEGEVNYKSSDLIVYATSGHIRRKLLNIVREYGTTNKITWFAEVLMVDEMHTGSIDNDIIISIWRWLGEQIRGKGIGLPRLVLSSATPISLERWFPQVIVAKIPMIVIETSSFPITILYHNKDYKIEDRSGLIQNDVPIPAADKTLYKDLLEFMRREYKKYPKGILIFVPGAADVEKLVHEFGSYPDVDSYAAYSSLDSEEIANIHRVPASGRVKIIVATNIAETSITIKDISLVVDTMREKLLESTPTGGTRLSLKFESKISAKQRCGRTGRTGPGTCYRMCTEQFFNTTLPDERVPEIERVPLHNILIELYAVGLTVGDLGLRVSNESVAAADNTLTMLGAIVRDQTGYVNVTSFGLFAPKFPLSVRQSSILWQWQLAGIKQIFPCIATVSMIDAYSPPYTYIPRKEIDESAQDYSTRVEIYKEKFFARYSGPDDLSPLILIWQDVFDEIADANKVKGISPWPTYRQIVQVSKIKSLNAKKVYEAITIAYQCYNTFARERIGITIGTFPKGRTIELITPFIVNSYSDMKMRLNRNLGQYNRLLYNQKTGKYDTPSKGLSYRLDTKNSLSTLKDTLPIDIVAILVTEISHVNIIQLAVKVPGTLDTQGAIVAQPLLQAPSVPSPKTREMTKEDQDKIAAALSLLSVRK